jgi:hypothetical protein
LLYERRTLARGHVPIDGADVVSWFVLPHLTELDAPTLEDGMVLAAEEFLDRPPRADLEPTHLVEQVGGDATGVGLRIWRVRLHRGVLLALGYFDVIE